MFCEPVVRTTLPHCYYPKYLPIRVHIWFPHNTELSTYIGNSETNESKDMFAKLISLVCPLGMAKTVYVNLGLYDSLFNVVS